VPEPPPDIVLYRTRYCGYCMMAARLLAAQRIAFREVDVSGDREARQWLAHASGQDTVPQLFVHGRPIGGYEELSELVESGQLAELLASKPARGGAGLEPEEK
jgi:glutaredoxin 3